MVMQGAEELRRITANLSKSRREMSLRPQTMVAAGTCQICERRIKAKSGLIAHHGYKRPHHRGWQTASCMGARHPPYEKSRDAIPSVILYIQRFIDLRNGKINEAKTTSHTITDWRGREIQPTDPNYLWKKEEYIRLLESDIAIATRDLRRLEQRFNEWKAQ